ncbi:hypothetical protein LTR17_026389, partial [Elasticomyces elasticus]
MEQLLQEADKDRDEPVHWALAGIVTGTDGRISVSRNYQEAVGDPQWGAMWKDAIQKELTAAAANKTWVATVLLKGPTWSHLNG